MEDLQKQVYIVGSNIAMEHFELHFSAIRGRIENARHFYYAKQHVENELLDSEINMAEILEVVKCMKDNKAPENDQIPVEFYKYAPSKLLELVRGIFNNVLDCWMVGRQKIVLKDR